MKNLYCIRDSKGRYNGHLNINSNSMVKRNSDWKWEYISLTYPMSGNLIRENVELKIMRLRELNSLAEYPLDWEVIDFTEQELLGIYKENIQKDKELGRSCLLSYHYNTNVETKEIKKDCIGQYRKLVDEIYKKYKYIVRQVGC